MNERIEELMVQAKFMAEETINKKISKNAELDAFAEKFAELIVKECANAIQAEKDTGLYNAQQLAGMTVSTAVINDHFGVE